MRPDKDANELFADPQDKAVKDPIDAIIDRPTTNDPKALKDKALSDKQKDLQAENDLKAVLSQPQGIRFVVRLLQTCGIDQPVFYASNSVMCEVAGRRQIANQLRDWIKNADLSFWFAVEKEFETVRPKPKTSERQK
jgi:hypothetical protein